MKKQMTVPYDKYYKEENLFGEPYPELVEFFTDYPFKREVLDLGCGQGRNAIVLAQLGYSVTGIDKSKVGINQMNRIGLAMNLDLNGYVKDVYTFSHFEEYDIVLMDSMFHFSKKDKEREIGLIKKIISEIRMGSLLVVCIQDTGNKIQTFNQAVDSEKIQKRLVEKRFMYTFKDRHSGHTSETAYQMIVIEK